MKTAKVTKLRLGYSEWHWPKHKLLKIYDATPRIGDYVFVETIFDEYIGIFQGDIIKRENGETDKSEAVHIVGIIYDPLQILQPKFDTASRTLSFKLPLKVNHSLLRFGFVKVLVHIPL